MNGIKNWPLKVKVLIPLILSVLYVNYFMTVTEFSTAEQARNAGLAGQYGIARNLYEDLLKGDPFNIDLHRKRINAHYRSPSEDKDAIQNEYTALALSDNPAKSDVGFYGLGFIKLRQGQRDDALVNYLRVKNKQLPYLNNSIGYIYLKQERFDLAEPYFVEETRLNENVSGAYNNLSRFYYESKQFEQMETLLSDEEHSRHVTDRTKRHYYMETGQYKRYSQYGFQLGGYTNAGLLAALLISAIWLTYLKYIDVFEPERVVHLLFAFSLGSLFSMLAIPLYDVFSVHLNFRLNGNYLNDFLFCIFGIGLIEELVKFIPFLIMLRFKSILNESVDYIVYASVCGLGFAFMENLIYFHEGGLGRITGRALSSSVLHMALTSMVAYGLFYADYKIKKNRIECVTIAFITACVIHGVYDFWIIADFSVSELRLISVAILIWVIVLYSKMITNALNMSEFNDGETVSLTIFQYLTLALTAIVIYQYLVIAFEFGPFNANLSILKTALGAIFPAWVIVGGLGVLQVSKGKWVNVFEQEKQ